MALTILNGSVVLDGEVREGTAVEVEGSIISSIKEEPTAAKGDAVDATGCYVFPGFIDLHVHGGAGADVSDGDPEGLSDMCRFHASHGTTSLLLTTRALPQEDIDRLLPSLSDYVRKPDPDGALPIGIHLEGPFVNPDYRGAQNPDHIYEARLSWMRDWVAAAADSIRIVTLAPELEASKPLIPWLAERGIVVSAGHTGADYDQMREAIELGVRHVTHCYNGMRGFTHRDPGMLAAIWMDERVTAELIMDGLHVHPAAGSLLVRTKGPGKVALITDAVRAAGMPDGIYPSAGGRTVRVEHGAVRLPSGSLAGSTLTMNQAVMNAVRQLGSTLPEAAEMASLTPAKVLGIDDRKGSIAVGKDADLVVTDRALNVLMTIREGRMIYTSR